MIHNLIFDFGKVLVDYDFHPVLSQIFPDPNDEQDFLRLFANQAFVDYCEIEEKPFIEIIREQQVLHPRFREAFTQYYERFPEFVTGEVPGMKALLQQLKAQGYRLYGLTNWCSRVHVTLKQYDIFNLIDGRIISSEEHLIKPDPAIYLRLCERFGLNPEDCLFTDDKAVNVEAAQRLGMKGIVFQNAEQFKEKLSYYTNFQK